MPSKVPAVDRAMRILNAFKSSQLEFGVTELSQVLDINKSTVHGIVQTLSEYRMLEQDPGSRRYRLGSGLIELGGLAQQRRDVRRVARAHLVELMERTQETVLLGVFEDDGITIIDIAEPARELRIAVATGQRLPFSAGSFGRAFMAWKPGGEVDRLVSTHGLKRYTKTTVIDPASYKTDLEKVRREGYAVDDSEEYMEGVWAVSAPIFDSDGILAVLTVVAFNGRLSGKQKEAAVKATVDATRLISAGLGVPAESGA